MRKPSIENRFYIVGTSGGVETEPQVIIYLGDDATDEDGFQVLQGRPHGFGVRVTSSDGTTAARYTLRGCEEVREFLASLQSILAESKE